jgi:ABC-type sugar transport system permease subunit
MAATTAAVSSYRASWWSRHQREVIPYLYIAPFFILFVVFGIFPILYSFWMSLFKGLGLGPKTFYGLGNYIYLFQDPRYARAFWNTVYFTLASIFVLSPLALLLALAIQSVFVAPRWRGFYRLVFFLPVVTSAVIIAVLFARVFDQRYGLLNQFLAGVERWFAGIGLTGIVLQHDWLRDRALVFGFPFLQPLVTNNVPVIGDIIKAGTIVLTALFLMNIWNFIGINSLYWTAGLNSIDHELYEAAAIDGAGRWQRFWYITWPLLRPMTLFIVIQAIAGSFALFAQPFLLTGGGPADATLTLSLYLYLQGFSVGNFGYANAIGYSMAVVTLALSLLNLWLFREQEQQAIPTVR